MGGPHLRSAKPDTFAGEIDALQDRMYEAVNNGVYRAGFATTQEAYEAAVGSRCSTMLAEMDARLADRRFLMGESPNRAGHPALFTTCVRFDPGLPRALQVQPRAPMGLRQPARAGCATCTSCPGLAGTVDLGQIRRHYYGSQRWVNPTGIVPVGPPVDLEAAPNRKHVGAPR